MDIKSIIDKLDINGFKVFWYSIFSQEKLMDYLYTKANSAINALLESNVDTIAIIREKLWNANDLIKQFWRYCPEPWKPYATALNNLLAKVWMTTEDYKLVTEETKEIIKETQIAYSVWMAD